MTSLINASGAYQFYTIPRLVSEGMVSFGPTNGLSSSWRKFVHTTTQQPETETAVTVIIVATERTTTVGPSVLEPASVAEEADVQRGSFFRFLDELESGAYAGDDMSDEE